MVAISNAMCTTFKAQSLQALHNFTTSTGHVFKLALIKSGTTQAYNANTTSVGTPGVGTPSAANLGTDEASGTGYTSGGFSWAAANNVTPAVDTSTGVAYTSFTGNPTWSGASFSTDGAILYNSQTGNNAVATFYFGGTQTVSSGTFTINLPTNNSSTALLRIA